MNVRVKEACVARFYRSQTANKLNILSPCCTAECDKQRAGHYEDVLRRELDGLDDDFATLKLLSQELSFRAQAIRAKKAA